MQALSTVKRPASISSSSSGESLTDFRETPQLQPNRMLVCQGYNCACSQGAHRRCQEGSTPQICQSVWKGSVAPSATNMLLMSLLSTICEPSLVLRVQTPILVLDSHPRRRTTVCHCKRESRWVLRLFHASMLHVAISKGLCEVWREKQELTWG